MKIFLSWSGGLSHKVACAFREWLPSVIQSVTPYVSSEDIDKGTRWSTDIAKELEESRYGIICVTKENVSAPWVNFEAGALSKSIDKSNVTPFLFNVKRSEVQGPLLQFQSAIYEKDEVYKLLLSISNQTSEPERLHEPQLKKTFEVWWPQLKEALDGLPSEPENQSIAKKADKSRPDILEEILDLVRSQQRVLSDPNSMLPIGYLRQALGSPKDNSHSFMNDELEEMHGDVIQLERILGTLKETPELSEALRTAGKIHDKLHSALGLAEQARFRRKSPSRTKVANIDADLM